MVNETPHRMSPGAAVLLRRARAIARDPDHRVSNLANAIRARAREICACERAAKEATMALAKIELAVRSERAATRKAKA